MHPRGPFTAGGHGAPAEVRALTESCTRPQHSDLNPAMALRLCAGAMPATSRAFNTDRLSGQGQMQPSPTSPALSRRLPWAARCSVLRANITAATQLDRVQQAMDGNLVAETRDDLPETVAKDLVTLPRRFLLRSAQFFSSLVVRSPHLQCTGVRAFVRDGFGCPSARLPVEGSLPGAGLRL